MDANKRRKKKRKLRMAKYQEEQAMDLSDLSYIDDIADVAHIEDPESKCLTCQHYCHDGAVTSITTLTNGKREWHVGANYCTLLGYYPNKMVFPPGLKSPIGDCPEVVECSEYSKGVFKKLRPALEIQPLEVGMGEALENLTNETDSAFRRLKESTRMPIELLMEVDPRLEKPATGYPIPNMAKPIETMDAQIVFDKYGKTPLPQDACDVLEISLGTLYFYKEEDFTVEAGIIQWFNPALMVGPHIPMTAKYVMK